MPSRLRTMQRREMSSQKYISLKFMLFFVLSLHCCSARKVPSVDLNRADSEPIAISKMISTLSKSDLGATNDVSTQGSKRDPLSVPTSVKSIPSESNPLEPNDVSTQGGIVVLPPHECDRPSCQPGGYPCIEQPCHSHVPIPQPPIFPTPFTPVGPLPPLAPCIQQPCHPYTPLPQPPIGFLPPLAPCIQQPCHPNVPINQPPYPLIPVPPCPPSCYDNPSCGSSPCPPWYVPEPCPCEPCEENLGNSAPAAAGKESANSEAHKINDEGQVSEQAQKESLHQLVHVPNQEKQEGAPVTDAPLGPNSEELVTSVPPGEEKKDSAPLLLSRSGSPATSETHSKTQETSKDKQVDETNITIQLN